MSFTGTVISTLATFSTLLLATWLTTMSAVILGVRSRKTNSFSLGTILKSWITKPIRTASPFRQWLCAREISALQRRPSIIRLAEMLTGREGNRFWRHLLPACPPCLDQVALWMLSTPPAQTLPAAQTLFRLL